MSNGGCVAGSEPAIVVCDAGPIIHLDELKCFDLLAYYETIYVPKVQANTSFSKGEPVFLRMPCDGTNKNPLSTCGPQRDGIDSGIGFDTLSASIFLATLFLPCAHLRICGADSP